MLACHGSWQIVMLGRFKDVQRYRISQPLHLRSIYIYLVCYVCCIYIYNYLFITRVHTHTYIYTYIQNICVLNIHHICTSAILLLFICIRLYWPMCMLQNNHQGIVIPLEEFIFWIAFVGEDSFSWFAHVKCSV